MIRLESMTSTELLALFNKLTGKSVKRFADRAQGLARVKKLAADPATQSRLLALLNLGQTEVTFIDVDKPLPTLEATLRQGAEERARAAGLPTLDGPVAKPARKAKAKADKAPAELVKLLSVKPAKAKKAKRTVVKAAATPQTLIKPIEGSKLVAAAGRVVRPENAEKVLAGKSLWGAVGAPPTEKDQLKGDNARLNLNYPAKKEVKPMREGTKRAKLVGVMRSKGVTIEDVMAMFQLTHDQAVYKVRDLHYMTGHGIETRNGRVFVTDK